MTDSNGNMVMPVAPTGNYGGGFGGWGDGIWWLFLGDLEGSRPELLPEQSIRGENYTCDESSV